jgi:hypothetical protein
MDSLMKKLFTFLMLASVIGANAQEKNPTTNDAAAKKILDAVSTKFKTYKSPHASFTYKV